MDDGVNFYRLIELSKSAKASVKSEALEVFKGVLEPVRTDEFASLLQSRKAIDGEPTVFEGFDPFPRGA